MKAGRNDACPCGSGKKYKKCCLGKDLVAAPAQPIVSSVLRSATGPLRANSVPATSSRSGLSSSPAQATKAPTPPPPPDPIAERGDRRWKEFESQSEDGRIAIFLETLEDAEVMSDSMAYEMLTVLHSDAAKRGDRPRFHELVGALRERRPSVFEQSAHFYLSWCISDALGENRLDAAASLTRELAARAGDDIDIFNRTAEALAYHGQLSLLVEAFRIALPSVRTSTNIVPWGVTRFMNMASDYEIFDYLERTSSPDPADPVLFDRVTYFVKDPRAEYLAEILNDLTEKSGREQRVEDFSLRPPPKKANDPWDEDEDEEEPEDPDPAQRNLLRLIREFVGYMHREEGVPFPRGQLVRNDLDDYFLERHRGDLDPRPSMLEQALDPKRKRPKPPRPAHPLCPERVTLEVFLARMMGGFNGLYYRAAAVFQAIPAWLRFLESRRLIDADIRQKVAKELLPLHATLSKIWQSYLDDPALAHQGQGWPADVAKGP
jgi:hypothetical protein